MSIAHKALPLWRLDNAQITFVAARENAVYRVEHESGRFALRLHRSGYRTDDQLRAELDWMAWVAKAGISVPAPKIGQNGTHLQIIDGVQVDILEWLGGDTLDAGFERLSLAQKVRVFHDMGQQMAKLHIASDAWPQGETCARPAWDVDGLLGPAPLWDRFWENPDLTQAQTTLFHNFRGAAKRQLETCAGALDYGLIHADLVPANVMIDGQEIHFIDFDDGGFGFRLFEIATALLKYRSDPDFYALKSAIIDGYHSNRPLEITQFDLFFAIRAMTYVGWNITRADEDKSGARNQRFIQQAEELATDFLDAA